MDENETLTAALPPEALSFVTPPGTTPGWLDAEMAASHGPVSGQHAHSHPAYNSQGDDQNHDHLHAHSADSHHGHDHSMKTPARAEPATEAAVDGHEPWTAAGYPELGDLLAAAYADVPEGGSLVAAAMETLGSPWGVEQHGHDWTLLSREGEVGTFTGDDGYSLALDALRQHAFADEQRPILAETWRSEMAFEGVKTPDGRQIDPGGLAYRDSPMPMMLQTTTDTGHYGAVLAGTIVSAGTQQQIALGSGEYDDTEAGRYALQIVQARGRFGVSIDGMSPAEAEAEIECDDDGRCSVVGIIFHLLTIGGVTMTPWPAFPDAYIALEQRAATAAADPEDETASGDPETPCEECAETHAEDEAARAAQAATAGGHTAAGKEDPDPTGKAATIPFTAASGPLAVDAPAAWFADPGFAQGDGRLVLQPDGQHWACPLTVTADGRVFGHMASWWTCHSGYQNACITPPRSRSNYAAFRLRPVMTADGDVVHVGHLTMGCGHASTGGRQSLDEIRAHYDGGPGAVRMAYVACGEDRFGIWFAGTVNPDATPEQVREFAALSVSGDWREVWRGKGLDLVACLAGVTVPGFPVASALAAAGLRVVAADEGTVLPSEPIALFTDGRPSALVAAGVVRRPMPWQAADAAQQHRVDLLEARLAAVERVANRLRPLAADALIQTLTPGGEVVTVPASNGHGG